MRTISEIEESFSVSWRSRNSLAARRLLVAFHERVTLSAEHGARRHTHAPTAPCAWPHFVLVFTYCEIRSDNNHMCASRSLHDASSPTAGRVSIAPFVSIFSSESERKSLLSHRAAILDLPQRPSFCELSPARCQRIMCAHSSIQSERGKL